MHMKIAGESQDSGLGGSTADVIVFGAGVSNGADTSRSKKAKFVHM